MSALGGLGITSFTTQWFETEEEAVASGLGTVHEMRKLGGLPSDWIVRIPK